MLLFSQSNASSLTVKSAYLFVVLNTNVTMDAIIDTLQQVYIEHGERALERSAWNGVWHYNRSQHSINRDEIPFPKFPVFVRARSLFAAAMISQDKNQRVHLFRVCVRQFEISILKEGTCRPIARKRRNEAIAMFNIVDDALRGGWSARLQVDHLAEIYLTGSYHVQQTMIDGSALDYGDDHSACHQKRITKVPDETNNGTENDSYTDPVTKKKRKILHITCDTSSLSSQIEKATILAEDARRKAISMLQNMSALTPDDDEVLSM